jgi:hypothetical protein
MQSQLDAMKSFSFANLQINNPVAATSPQTGTVAKPASQLYVLDGELADAPSVEFWSELAELLPHNIRVGGPNDATSIISDLHAELQSRQDREPQPPVFLLIDNLGRFRDLRRDEDDYSFSSSKQAAATPAAGIHVVVWADTYNNASRWMTSQTMRELELRVGFQMSATDSSNFIDSPAAGRLGQNRALLYLEETGALEKFRPYGATLDDWSALLGVDEGTVPGPAPEDTSPAPVTVADEAVEPAEGATDDAAMIPDFAIIADDDHDEALPETTSSIDDAATVERQSDASADNHQDASSDTAEEADVVDDLSSWTIL